MTRVLVVDDDPVSRMLLKHLLTTDGHEVEEETDGSKALERIRSGATYDLIISDESMPHMTGRQLRAALGPTCTTPFVLLTSTVLDDFEQESKHGYLTKPVGSTALKELVARVLG